MPNRHRLLVRLALCCACLLPIPAITQANDAVPSYDATHLPMDPAEAMTALDDEDAPPSHPFWHAFLLVAWIVVPSLLWNWRLQGQVSERRAAQDQLCDQLAFQFSLLNGLPTPLYVRDLEGRLTTCNRAYENFFGSSLEELRGTRVQQLPDAPPELVELLAAEYRQLLLHRQPRYFDCRIESAGRTFHVYHWLVPFYSARGTLQGLLGGWIDISDRKHLEDRLREAQQAAVKASAVKSRFLATMSHELRTPLNALVGLLELETTTRAAPTENLRIAQQSAHSMIDLIGNILDLDKIESGQMQLAPQPTDLDALLRGSLDLFAAQAREKGLDLSFQCALPAARHYLLDPLRLRQVLHNLLGNAVRFTHQGHVTLQAAALEQSTGKCLLRIEVSDSGIGIPVEFQPRIFDAYRQAHTEVSNEYGGSGLGLSICRHLTSLMGGRIWLESELGQGCRVHVELPLAWTPADDSVKSAPVATVAGDLTGLEVLIVDDVSTNGLVLQQQLASLGHRGTFVSDAESALRAWAERPFDVLISDCNMPGMDGYALTRAVRARESAQGVAPIRIIGYTASALSGEESRCREAGMDELMIKPVTLARLRGALGGALPAIDPVPATASAGQGFDLSHLEGLQGIDPALLDRLLTELRASLTQERQRLQSPLPADDPEAVGQVAHRLAGLACTIDAPGLMQACHGLSPALARGANDLRRQQAEVVASLETLLRHVEERLAGASPWRPHS
ncbi:ATP-binding protein [Pseudomonas resinovorans]|uniref:ATP-binding protein n=1 Tax=Metapseudomonas resinovorans TaxID=53412 RepID=UPI00237FB8D8|nr:ATP-binding protein [Pseudomonas resinovorans]MDE3737350.1 ATP-binding protein [Pseudomonas resinovorans]